MIDLYQSRTGKNYRCSYYKRDKDGVRDNNTLTHETEPSGVFYAEIISEKNKEEETIGNVFRVNATSLTIRTNDIVDIENDDLVFFMGKNWIVMGVSERIVQKNSEFSISASKITTIIIRSA